MRRKDTTWAEVKAKAENYHLDRSKVLVDLALTTSVTNKRNIAGATKLEPDTRS